MDRETSMCVSVIIAAYKSEGTLSESIASVLNQTYPSLELIICDDGTEGFDVSAVLRQCASGGRVDVVVLHQAENVGTVRNLNAGVARATGDWILFLAADDVLAGSEVVAQLAATAASTEKHWILSKTSHCNSELNVIDARVRDLCEMAPFLDKQIKDAFFLLSQDCFLPASGMMIRRDFLVSMGFFDEAYRLVEDWPFFIKAIVSGCFPVLSPVISTLHREGGVSNLLAGKNEVYQRDLITVMEREILPRLDLLVPIQRDIIRRHCQDKIHIFTLRFRCTSPWAKALWCIRHPGVLWRKIRSKYKERFHDF